MGKPSLHEVLKLSYSNRDKQKEGLKKYGYNYDDNLSNHNQQVYYNPKKQKMIYSITGTHNVKDWSTNAYLGLGKLKDTDRYKESDETLKKAKEIYKPRKVAITGHSQSGATASYIAKPEDKVYTLDKATTIGQSYRPNEKAYRTSGDLVSILGINHKNMETLANKNLFKNVLTNHSVDNIKNEKIFI
jgi:hypothetical protein